MMKTYEEMSRDALERIKDYENKRKKRKKTAMKAVFPAIGLCLVAVFCVIFIESGGSFRENSLTADSSEENTATAEYSETTQDGEKETTGITEHTAKGTDESPAEGSAILLWKNKLKVYPALYRKLTEDPEGTYNVTATYLPATAEITDFVYEGETLSELAVKAYEERVLFGKISSCLRSTCLDSNVKSEVSEKECGKAQHKDKNDCQGAFQSVPFLMFLIHLCYLLNLFTC